MLNKKLGGTLESEPTASAVKPLPKGYLWRLGVLWALVLSGTACMFFFNSLIGMLILAAGFIFGKYSGLSEMNDSCREDTEKEE